MSPSTTIIQANAVQPTSPTVSAPSTPWTTAQQMSTIRATRPGARSRAPATTRSTAHRSRNSPETPPRAQVPLDITSGSVPARDMSWFFTTVPMTTLMITMPTASTASTSAAMKATSLRTTTLTPCYQQYVR